MENIPNSDYSFTTYGIGTPRYRSFLCISPHELLIPLGPNLLLCDFRSKTRRFLAITQSVIMVIQPLFQEKINENSEEKLMFPEEKRLIAAVSYNGEISIVDLYEWRVLKKFRSKGSCIRHASLFNDKLLVCAEEFKEFKKA